MSLKGVWLNSDTNYRQQRASKDIEDDGFLSKVITVASEARW